jgi:t-SNARE complex subunit (syntaxin)
MTTLAQQEILEITDIEVLRGLCLIADTMIQALGELIEDQDEMLQDKDETIERLQANAIGYRSEIAEANVDARRYELLKLLIPSILELAADAGANVAEAQEIFANINPLKIDGMLDEQLDAGVLEQLYDELDAQAEAALEA